MNARKHHYQFAYQHIPNNLWTQAGRRMTARLLTDEALAVIRFYWRQTGDELPPEARLSPDGLSCTLHDAGHGLAVLLVQMPPAQIQPEAILVALLIDPREHHLIRYFTLELSQPGLPPMIGERLRGGRRNLGDGPSDARGFLAFVRDRVARMAADLALGDEAVRGAQAAWHQGDLPAAGAQLLQACAAFDEAFADERLMAALAMRGDGHFPDCAAFRAQAVWLGFARAVSVEAAFRAVVALREVLGVKGPRAAIVASALMFKLDLCAAEHPQVEAWRRDVSRMVFESAPAGASQQEFMAWIDAHGIGDSGRCFANTGDIVDALRGDKPWAFNLTRVGLPPARAQPSPAARPPGGG